MQPKRLLASRVPLAPTTQSLEARLSRRAAPSAVLERIPMIPHRPAQAPVGTALLERTTITQAPPTCPNATPVPQASFSLPMCCTRIWDCHWFQVDKVNDCASDVRPVELYLVQSGHLVHLLDVQRLIMAVHVDEACRG